MRVLARCVFALILLSYVLCPSLVSAQCSGITTPPVPFNWEVLTIGTTATALTAAKYQPAGSAANMAQLTVESGDIRYLVTGNPTATDGHYVGSFPPQTFTICGLDSIKAFRVIRVSSDAKLTVTYYKTKSP